MILITEIKRILFRFPKRTLLTASIAAALLCCFTGYLGNIQSGQDALAYLGQIVPVTVQVVNRDGGDSTQNLEIKQATFQGLMRIGVKDAQYSATARISVLADDFSPESGKLGDSLLGINDLTILDRQGINITFTNGERFDWEGPQAVCLLQETYADAQRLSVGDTYTPHIYLPRYNTDGLTQHYEKLETKPLKVIGIMTGDNVPFQVVVPIEWLWLIEKEANIEPVCSSFQGIVSDPMQLNDFKKKLPACGLARVVLNSPSKDYKKNALLVNDKQYIETAEQLIQNNMVLESFRPFFFLMLILITVMVTFLLMRYMRRNIALAMALGQPRLRCVLPYFCSTLIANLIGGLIVFIPMWLITHISMAHFLSVYGIFYLCVALGVGAALWIVLRFDIFALLSTAD